VPLGTRQTIVGWLLARSEGDYGRLAGLTASDALWDSPVAGTSVGRDALVQNVREGFEEVDRFSSELLALECRGDRGVAVVHNTGVRNDEALDSLQTMFIRVAEGTVVEVRIAVDDEGAVESFWSE
jgi:ketosteroid isomerase-like protein